MQNGALPGFGERAWLMPIRAMAYGLSPGRSANVLMLIWFSNAGLCGETSSPQPRTAGLSPYTELNTLGWSIASLITPYHPSSAPRYHAHRVRRSCDNFCARLVESRR